jgi:hypothetical protein
MCIQLTCKNSFPVTRSSRNPFTQDRNPAYSKLLNQRKIVEEVIEDVVKFQHGGLNHSVDTMSEVVREYTRGRDDIQGLRKSLAETQGVLTAKKVGQVPLKELWQKKVELQETLRMVKDLESLKVGYSARTREDTATC